jgi:hypothetical protein
MDKLRVRVLHNMESQLRRIGGIEVAGRDDLVGVDVRAVQKENAAVEVFHLKFPPAISSLLEER